jgi:hypothetical protein
MRSRVALGLAAAVLASAVAVQAEELKSGLAVGKSVPAFDVVKCGGAPKDGVKEGQQLCYR